MSILRLRGNIGILTTTMLVMMPSNELHV